MDGIDPEFLAQLEAKHAKAEVGRFESQAWSLIAAAQRARAAKAADMLRAGDVVGALAELEALARLPLAPEHGGEP